MLPTIQCKHNDGIPQAINYQATYLQKHNYEAIWDGLQFMNTL